MSKNNIGIVFDTTKMSEEQIKAIGDAETLLGKAGISFGHSYGTENDKTIDITWDWDFDLSGPVKVELRNEGTSGPKE